MLKGKVSKGDETGRSVGGEVFDDPLKHLPIGSKINFKPVVFHGSDANDRAQSVANWHALDGAILGVVLKSAQSSSMIGTAVMVAPGIAVTASHLFSHVL